MTKQTIQNYRDLIATLNNHENNQHADMLTITAFFKDVFEYQSHVVPMLNKIPTNELNDYKVELEACNYDVEFIKSLRA